MKKGRGSHHTTWHESVFLEDPNRNPAGFYFGHRVWEWWAFGCQREILSRNWEARINMNNCCSIPPQLRSLYCKCCLNAYPFTPFVSWTFIITSLLYSSGENEQYTWMDIVISFYHVTAAPGDYWVTFWVPVPDKWCFGITHWGEWKNSKAKNKKQKHDYPNNYIKDSLFTRKNVFIVQYLFLSSSLHVQLSCSLLNLVASGTGQLIKWLLYSNQSRSCDRDVFKWVMHKIPTQHQVFIWLVVDLKVKIPVEKE